MNNKSPLVYILSNSRRAVVYVGVTSNISQRLEQHRSEKPKDGFCGRYNVFDLIYYEQFENIESAIMWEKKLKGYSRKKKYALIYEKNPLGLSLSID